MLTVKPNPKLKGAQTHAPGALKKTRILVVDDHPVVREGLARVIENQSDLMICGQAATIPEALAVLAASKPDVAIVDISLGGHNAIELIKDIKVRHPELPVLVHSMHDESVYAERSLRAGAKGYIMKQEPPQNLVVALRQVLAGEIYLSQKMTKEIVHRATGKPTDTGAFPLHQLSDREFEVFELLGQGVGTREIGQRLHLSPKTVQTHREKLKCKLNLKDGMSLVRFATQWAEAQS
jgi:DNA-binding NarL/FixJ family response regulator